MQGVYLHIPQLLDPAALEQATKLMAAARFEDGKMTATGPAREVKANRQMSQNSPEYFPLQQLLLDAMNRNMLFRDVTFPRNVYPFLFSKYNAGMQYGWHVDSPVMGNMMRSDIAMTIFLNGPEAYEGGELVLQGPTGQVAYKLAAGDAICYPCTQLHKVSEVTSGERQVAVTWVQSMVRDAEKRRLLFELRQVQEQLSAATPNNPLSEQLMQTHSNLLRMWAE